MSVTAPVIGSATTVVVSDRGWTTGGVNVFERMTRMCATDPSEVTSISRPDALSVQRPPTWNAASSSSPPHRAAEDAERGRASETRTGPAPLTTALFTL